MTDFYVYEASGAMTRSTTVSATVSSTVEIANRKGLIRIEIAKGAVTNESAQYHLARALENYRLVRGKQTDLGHEKHRFSEEARNG